MISIITPFYNAEKFLAESIESVIAQTYTDWELLLIDDGSTDQSSVIASTYTTADTRIKLLSLNINSGPGIARNKGIEEARGSKIAFLDADDLWEPHKLSRQLAFMKKHKAAICYSSYTLINERGLSLHKKIEALPLLHFNKLRRANYIGNLTGIYDVEILGKTFAPFLRKRQDWALWLDLVKKAGKAYGISESLASYRVRKDAVSSNKWQLLKYNYAIFRSFLGYGSLKSCVLMIRFLWEQTLIKPQQIHQI